MDMITWGMIGCGDVTEVKSGPAFNKVPHSSLHAVMRRDAVKAADYAKRHGVPKWYADAQELINDPVINAVYIATPPASHEDLAIQCLAAGKMVYVEKPMTMDRLAAMNMMIAADKYEGKLVVAHYRRQQPFFLKIKALIEEGHIGDVQMVQLHFYRKLFTKEEMAVPKKAWRVDPAISGGGLFHDIAPHQLDMMIHLFGSAVKAHGFAVNTNKLYDAPDTICGDILFHNNILFTGNWCFNMTGEEADHCEIIGTAGKISFAFFGGTEIHIQKGGETNLVNFDPLQHVQQPMIEAVVEYFRGNAVNPCPASEGVQVMSLIEQFTKG